MKWASVITLTVLATGLAVGDDRRAGNPTVTPAPPVLKRAEPDDSVVVTLPGAPLPEKPPAAAAPAVPSAATLPAEATDPTEPPDPGADLSLPTEMSAELEDLIRPSAEAQPAPAAPTAPTAPPAPVVAAAVPRVVPQDLQADSGDFFQKHIGQWSEAEARALLGDPIGQREALDEKHACNGQILQFADPSGRYKQLELDFDHETGRLRTVFVYPRNLTWTECHHLYGGKVNASLANKGRKFYSFLDRKLDVLVDPAGKVISLGIYEAGPPGNRGAFTKSSRLLRNGTQVGRVKHNELYHAQE